MKAQGKLHKNDEKKFDSFRVKLTLKTLYGDFEYRINEISKIICKKQFYQRKNLKRTYDIKDIFHVILELMLSTLDQLQKDKVLKMKK